jgi:hypothetical protein
MALKIKISKDDAAKRTFEDLPEGWYKVRIEDVELRESKSEKNKDKDGWPRMYVFEFIVTEDSEPFDDDGASIFAGRRFFNVNACLWEGALFTIIGIMRALGVDLEEGEGEIPDITDPEDEMGGIEFFLGKELMLRNGISRNERKQAREEKRAPRTQPNAFKSLEDDEAPAASSKTAVPATGRRRVLA